MAIETELKLRIAPESLIRLKRHALFKSLAVTQPVKRRLYNIYYDTPKLALHKAEMALRLRRAGRQWLQTLKGGGSMQAGLHQRNEWEIPVSGPALDFSSVPANDWGAHLPPALRRKLQPVFVTDFSRTSRMLNFHGAEIELCIDQGLVSTEQYSTPICELELELKSGDPRQLFELALEILDVAPFALEGISKAEHGYRLLSGYIDKPVRGEVAVISCADTLAEVLQKIIWSCLQHLQGNVSGAMQSDDTEYLHQMRVALRRLRVALRIAEKRRPDSQLAQLNEEVASLCVALGRVRELDVFIGQTLRPMCKRMAGHAGLQALLAACERQRAGMYAALRGEPQARALQRLMLRLGIWMNGSYWQQQGGESPPARDFAALHLGGLAAKFSRSGKQLNAVDAERLHALRILAKKLRYSAEFFSGLYDRKKARAFLAGLSEVQKVLGQINDIAVAHRLLDELAEDASLRSHGEAITLARGWIAHDLAHQFEKLHDTVRVFKRQAAFWEQ